jgi:ribosomal protein L29
MKSKELRQKDSGEIQKMLYEKKEALRALRSNLSGSKSKNVKEVSTLRKDIARMLTEINAKRLKA